MDAIINIINELKADLGGTNISGPLDSIYEDECYSKINLSRNIFLLTDGQVFDREQCINIISTNKNNEINEKELEKGLISNINNLRMNPTMYYEKYISFNSKYIWTKEYLEKIKDEIRDPLGEDKKANDYIIEYFNISKIQMLTKKLHKNKITETLSEMDETLRYLINEEVGSTKIVKVKSIITQKENPIDIIVQYLLDKKYRSNIFDPYSKALTIKIIKNFYNNSALVVIVIIQDKDNVLLDEPTSM